MINLQEYFPDSKTTLLTKASGAVNTRYTFRKNPQNGLENIYTTYMDLNKPGVPYMWRKEYFKNNAWCTETYAILFFGTDNSIIETGDWYSGTPCTPDCALGYKTSAGVNTGLIWCPSTGLTETPVIAEMDVWRQNTAGSA